MVYSLQKCTLCDLPRELTKCLICRTSIQTLGTLQKQCQLYPDDQNTDCWFQGADTIPTPTADCKTIKETSAPQIRKEILTCHVDPTMDLPCIVQTGLLFRKVLSYNITNPLLSVTLRSRRLTCMYKFVCGLRLHGAHEYIEFVARHIQIRTLWNGAASRE